MLFPSSIQNIQPTWLFSSYQAGEVSFLVSEINLILLLVLKYLHSSIVFTPLYNFLTCFQSIDSFLFKQAEEAQPTHTHTHRVVACPAYPSMLKKHLFLFYFETCEELVVKAFSLWQSSIQLLSIV